MRRSGRRGRKRRGLLPDAAASAAAAICPHSPPPHNPVACLLSGGCFPVLPPLCFVLACSLPRMDLVGVASPEPRPAAAWEPSKVSGGRGRRTCLGHLGRYSWRAQRGWLAIWEIASETPAACSRRGRRQGCWGGGKRSGEGAPAARGHLGRCGVVLGLPLAF